jgi:hypothetical protein
MSVSCAAHLQQQPAHTRFGYSDPPSPELPSIGNNMSPVDEKLAAPQFVPVTCLLPNLHPFCLASMENMEHGRARLLSAIL